MIKFRYMRGPEGFFWDALSCWSIGHTAGFFNAINCYKAFEPAPWDRYLWAELMKSLVSYSAE